MKIVDVIGEKVYKDGERIITQVSGGLVQHLSQKPPPEGVVHHLSCHFGELMLHDTQAHFLQSILKPIDVQLTDLCTSLASIHLSLASGVCSFGCHFLLTLSKLPTSLLKPGEGRKVVYLLSMFGTKSLLANLTQTSLQ